MEISIREGNLNDYKEVNELNCQIQDIHVQDRPDIYKKTEIPLDKDYYSCLLKDENARVILAIEGGHTVGYSIFQIKVTPNRSNLVYRKIIYIDDICIDENYRGKGIGEKLFKFIAEYGKSVGAHSLELSVWEFNKGAIDFYNKMGMSTKNRRMEVKL
ncbi:MAG: GNAT family N-acetyltransferase [Bacillota bacterium]|nr:GNAT family N-acetyltransferase [Bacillota bacterium]